ncbi:MAG: MFS transporter [Sphingobium sp.]|nr:MFS transporter [Sphingobium sp.]
MEQGAPSNDSNALRLRTVIACNIGVCLEGFDFIAYTAFAAIIGKLFFPAGDALAGALLVFGGFGAAYVARPVGGLFWGVYADRFGRRRALATIAMLMGLGTLGIAIAPTYAAVGMVAPVIVLTARLVQGFAASGEFASATAMLVELAPPGRRAFYASSQMAAQVVTIGLATGVAVLLSDNLTPEALESWGWRFVFVLGALLAPFGLYMRTRLAESPVFLALQSRGRAEPMPIGHVLRAHMRALAQIAGIVVISAAALYLILVFMPVFAGQQLGLPPRAVRLTIILCAFAEMPVILLAGWMADRWGAARLLLLAALAYALIAPPLLVWLVHSPSMAVFALVELACALLLGMMTGPMPLVISGLLPASVRSSGIGLVFNLVGAIFGGLGPFLITAYVGMTGDLTGPAWWALFTALVGVLAAEYVLRYARGDGAVGAPDEESVT